MPFDVHPIPTQGHCVFSTRRTSSTRFSCLYRETSPHGKLKWKQDFAIQLDISLFKRGFQMTLDPAISWTALVAASIFVLTQVFKVLEGILERRQDRRKPARAILSEIESITSMGGEAADPDGFDEFIDGCSVQEINAFAMPTYKSVFYQSYAENIPAFPLNAISEIMRCYRLVDRMNSFILHFKSKEFIEADQRVQDSMKHILKMTNREMHEAAKVVRCSLKEYV
jgi:hypothetical protein